MFDDKHPLFGTYKVAKRVAIGIVGGTVLLLGVIMMVTPGPGIAGILAGLGILAIEFTWARIWLKKVKAKSREMAKAVIRRNGTPAAVPVASEAAKPVPPRDPP